MAELTQAEIMNIRSEISQNTNDLKMHAKSISEIVTNQSRTNESVGALLLDKAVQVEIDKGRDEKIDRLEERMESWFKTVNSTLRYIFLAFGGTFIAAVANLVIERIGNG